MMERCEICSGEGEIEICTICNENIENCTCLGDMVPPIETITCSECDGDGEIEVEEVEAD